MDRKRTMWGYWGKFHQFEDDKKPRMIWIGPMTEDEMLDSFSTYRHNYREEEYKAC